MIIETAVPSGRAAVSFFWAGMSKWKQPLLFFFELLEKFKKAKIGEGKVKK